MQSSYFSEMWNKNACTVITAQFYLSIGPVEVGCKLLLNDTSLTLLSCLVWDELFGDVELEKIWIATARCPW